MGALWSALVPPVRTSLEIIHLSCEGPSQMLGHWLIILIPQGGCVLVSKKLSGNGKTVRPRATAQGLAGQQGCQERLVLVSHEF
jgi:hypothetical protein